MGSGPAGELTMIDVRKRLLTVAAALDAHRAQAEAVVAAEMAERDTAKRPNDPAGE